MDQIEGMFLSEGFSHLTIDDVVARVRCSKVTLYALAPSREELTLAILGRFFDTVDASMASQIDEAEDPAEKVDAFMTSAVEGMGRMSATCFKDIVHYSTTRAIYESFSQSCSDRLTTLLGEAHDENLGADRIAFVAEFVRLVLDDLFAGELEARTGIPADIALAQLTAVTRLALGHGEVSPPNPRITRIK
jgi:AcrR family transcriptional regulator